MQRITQFCQILRLRPFDTSTEEGRSKERLRRAALTTVSAGAARLVGMLASLITVPLTYSYLGPERYGLWMVLLSIIAMMGFADLGIGSGLVNAVSEAYGRDDEALAREYITSAIGMLLSIAAVLTLAGIIAYPFLPWMRLFNVKSATAAAEGAQAFVVLYGWFVINIPLGVIARIQAGLQKGYLPQIVGAAGNIATLLALLIVIHLHGSLAWLVFGSTFGVIVSTLVNGWMLFREHPALFPAVHAFRSRSVRRIFNLGIMYFILNCAVAVGYTSDNIVITQILGAAAVAAYAVPQKLFNLVLSVASMAITPLWPAYGEALARGDVKWVRKAFWGSLWATLGVTAPVCLLLTVIGPWMLRILFGKALHASWILLLTLAIWSVVGALSNVGATLLSGLEVVRFPALLSIVTSGTNLALSIFFTRRIGVVGVCLGSILSQVLIAYPAYYFVIRSKFRAYAAAGQRRGGPTGGNGLLADADG